MHYTLTHVLIYMLLESAHANTNPWKVKNYKRKSVEMLSPPAGGQ